MCNFRPGVCPLCNLASGERDVLQVILHPDTFKGEENIPLTYTLKIHTEHIVQEIPKDLVKSTSTKLLQSQEVTKPTPLTKKEVAAKFFKDLGDEPKSLSLEASKKMVKHLKDFYHPEEVERSVTAEAIWKLFGQPTAYIFSEVA